MIEDSFSPTTGSWNDFVKKFLAFFTIFSDKLARLSTHTFAPALYLSILRGDSTLSGAPL
jgi:hypothetical protein